MNATGPEPRKPGEPNPKAPVGSVSVIVLVATLGALLIPAEGGRRLVPYRDSVGIPTACTGIIGAEVTRRYQAHERFTDAECQALESAYLTRQVRQMQACTPQAVLNTVTVGEFLAYGHWAYNTGTGAYCNSSLHRKLLAGDHIGACRAMGQWTFVTAGGRKVDCHDPRWNCTGIVKRRDMEVSMCLGALN